MATKFNDIYFVKPSWGPTDAGRRCTGTSMKVVLGPLAVDSRNYGSRTNPSSIHQAMVPLKRKDYIQFGKNMTKKGLWVAGHLLNDNLGGSGTQTTNLTPLTQTANKNHATYENYVKNMLIVSGQLVRAKSLNYMVGVEYQVNVFGQFGDFKPYCYAPSHIKVFASLIKADNVTRELSAMSDHDVGELASRDHQRYLRQTFSWISIDNEDSHLTTCANEDCMHD